MREKLKEQVGASAVEFAIVVTVLVLFLFGVIQFGIMYNRYQELQAAAREGARLAALPSATVSEIEDRIRSVMNDPTGEFESCPAGEDQYCISISPSGSASSKPCFTADLVSVTITHQMKIVIPMWDTPTINLTGNGQFRCET